MAEKETKKKSLEDVLKDLNKEYGSGSVMNGEQLESYTNVISTGSLGLDINLGIGGLPLGKIVEIYGWESSGKSTLCQTIIGNAQKMGLKCLYLDGENSIDETYFTNLGGNLKDLLIIQLDEHAGEGAYNKMEKLVETGEINVVIIDSYNSLQPAKIMNGEMGESSMGVHARMLGQVVMKTNSLAKRHNVLFIYVGQIREKIGVLWGSPETPQGGNSLRFYSHIRLKVSRSTTTDNSIIGENKEKLGNKTTVKIEKTKFGSPFKENSFNIIYKEGIDKYNELIDLAHEYEVIKIWGKQITELFGDKLKYDKNEYLQIIKEQPELFESLRQKVLNRANPKLSCLKEELEIQNKE